MDLAGYPACTGHSQDMKLNSNTEHMSVCVAIAFQLSRSSYEQDKQGSAPVHNLMRLMHGPAHGADGMPS